MLNRLGTSLMWRWLFAPLLLVLALFVTRSAMAEPSADDPSANESAKEEDVAEENAKEENAKDEDAKDDEKAEEKDSADKSSIGLDGYTLVDDPLEIDGVEDNASGIAYNPETKTLFMVLNSPTQLIELTKEGEVKRRIALRGFDDTEDVAFIADKKFVVAEERRFTIATFELKPEVSEVSYDAATKQQVTEPDGVNGLEGVTYRPSDKSFFVLKEKAPRQIFLVPPADDASAHVTEPWDMAKDSLGLRDVSGIHYHAPSGHLLIISHETQALVELTVEGKEVSRMSLTENSAGLTEDIDQAEGVTMDEEGNLYLVGEPNLFYRFEK